MLAVVMCLKQGDSQIKLKQNASNAPHIASLVPAQLENDFGSAVMPGRDNSRMMLMIKCCRAKVDQLNFSAFDALNVLLLRIKTCVVIPAPKRTISTYNFVLGLFGHRCIFII